MNSAIIGRLLLAILMALPLASLGEAAKSPIDTPEFSTVVATPDIKEPLTNNQLSTCMRETARIMKVEDQAKPQIVILQLSPTEAKRLGLTQTVLLSNRGKTAPHAFYEVWIIGQYPVGDLARGVEMVFELHYGLKYTDVERGKVVGRISNILGGTVSVNALRDKYQGSVSR